MLTRPGRHPRQQGGISLIEIMIGLALMIILLALGLPNFSEWLQNSQIRTAAESTLSAMQLARGEAVKRNLNVEFVLTNPNAQGGTGWTVREAADGTIIQRANDGEGSRNVILTPTPADANIVTFNSFGRLPALNLDGSPNIARINIDVPESVLAADKSVDLRITVTTGGQIRLCDPSIVTTGDPRKC